MKPTVKLFSWTFALVVLISACSTSQSIVREVEPIVLPEMEMVTPNPLPTYAPVPAGRFDNGRMWTFEYAPSEYFSKEYNFDANQGWFDHARMASVRLPNCSGSFVSAQGLVMTNHHCAREQITQVGRDGESLLDDGFYAATLADERKIENYYVDQMIDIRDVTDQILSLVDAAPMELRSEVRQQAIADLQAELQSEVEDGHVVQVVSLYNGGRYSAYLFKRYTDVRLVMAPELQIGYYGGDDDNFTYPRYNLDMTFYRVYENDQPLEPEHFFPFSRTGVSEGDAVFMIGNPGSTTRQNTVAQLTYRGQYGDNYYHNVLSRGIIGLEAYYQQDPAGGDAMDLRNYIFGLKNADKFYGGQVLALRDPVLMGRRVDNEIRFKAQLSASPELGETYLSIIDDLEELQIQKIDYSPYYYATLAISPNSRLSSAVMQRALFSHLYANYLAQGVSAQDLAPLKNQVLAIADRPAAWDIELLTQRLHLFVDILGADHEVVQAMLGGSTPEDVARRIVRESALATSTNMVTVMDGDILNSDDPALKLVASFAVRVFEAQQVYSQLSEAENELSSQLGRAWFAVYGTDLPPDATFSLRISDGVVKSYRYNGTVAPYFTTFYGMYDRAVSHDDPQWDLPARWEKPSITMDLSTPLNFVSTNDIIGGNSGSPLVNRNLEVVGLAFDSNIEGMGSSDFILDSERARSVNVDARGMIEALRHVYRADRLVNEILTAGSN
jgi:hypothetical protein